MHICQLIKVQFIAPLKCNYLLFFSLIFCAWFKTISVFPGSSWLQNLSSVIDFTELLNLVFPFLIHNECQPITTTVIDNYVSLPILKLRQSSACMFLFLFLSLVLPTKCIYFQTESADVFSIASHVFRNLFLKMCPLFGQIWITCLKCSRASFSPSSYSEKMRWGRGWGAMKYFKHILMGHEIFFKVFDRLRNIFLRSIFIILFFKLKG